MKCVSLEECRSWLAPTGRILDEALWLRTSDKAAEDLPHWVVIEKVRGRTLAEFSRRLFDWMPVGRERLLVVSSWSHYPPDQAEIFETIRKGCGVSQSLAEAPGHLFVSTKNKATSYDERPVIDVIEESVAMWLMAMMLEWTWEGYAIVQGCRDAIYLGDGFVQFLSPDPARHRAARALVREFGLTSRDTFPWQGQVSVKH